MQIRFRSKKLEKTFNSKKELQREFGPDQAAKIMTRMKTLEAAANLAEVPTQKPDRRHQLKGQRKEQFAVDVRQPFRLIFQSLNPLVFLGNGAIDLTKVTGILILGVEDYHGE